MWTYKVLFHKNIEKDLRKLDKSILIFFEKKLKQIIKNPKIWIDLWNKLWIDLSWFKKVYFANKKYRIVYKIEKEKILVYIISVWKRENLKVYKEAYRRL